MARNDEGEFELILGNRQLLSVFFIVVVLLGLCFLMGYVIGRNSAPTVSAENVPVPETSSEPIVIPSVASAPSQGSETEESALKTVPQADSEPAPLPPPKPAPPAKTQQAKAETPKPEPAKQQAKQEEKLPSLPPSSGSQPAPGAYLQLSATSRPEAEAYLDRLRGQSFPSVLSQVPGQDLYRVLVGPFPDNPTEIQRMRSRLNAAKFPGNDAIPRRY